MNSQFGTSLTIKEGRKGKWRRLQIRVENVKKQSACATTVCTHCGNLIEFDLRSLSKGKGGTRSWKPSTYKNSNKFQPYTEYITYHALQVQYHINLIFGVYCQVLAQNIFLLIHNFFVVVKYDTFPPQTS